MTGVLCYSDFDVNGKRIRVVTTTEKDLYVLHRVGSLVAVLKQGGGGGYTIDARGRCSCPGFRNRQRCKHTTWGGETL